jgi:TrmH family RNA methyltransferase
VSDGQRRFRIVLCRPKFSGNIGFVCRAMKAMGMDDLAIVGDQAAEDAGAVNATAVHAADIYAAARRSDSLPAAIADCVFVAGTTRRRGQHRKRAILLPEAFAEMVDGLEGTIALVFGNEESGLTSDELESCSAAVTIPSDEAFPSLNLSHAVQIMAYVLFRHEWNLPTYTPADTARVSRAVTSIIEHLSALDHFHHMGSEPTRRLLSDVIGRAAVTEGELRELERIFRKIRYRTTDGD